jgi:2-polyprenyl-6-methoxyphenol hydroxylase-like FAD-dependent oxidoreductase
MTDADVIVVGYGPVGMVTAALLGRAGQRVIVLERHAGLCNLPRAGVFDDETMRTFARLGIAEEMLPKVRVQSRYEWTGRLPGAAGRPGPSFVACHRPRAGRRPGHGHG